MTALVYFNKVIGRYSIQEVASYLGLHSNTVLRWQEQNKVPKHYETDLCRLLGKENNVAQQTAKDKDQYYTKPATANYCYQKFKTVASSLGVDVQEYCFIEPAVGCGWFYHLLPPDRRIGVDIDPSIKNITRADYLAWRPRQKDKYIVLGNPPFGLRGHLALQFINHSLNFADIVAFILPPLFDSDGKGVPAKRVREYSLAHTEKLPNDSFIYPDGTDVEVSTIFQVWTRVGIDRIRIPQTKTCKQYIRVYSLSDGGTPSSTRNKKMLYECDVYMPSTCFSGMHLYSDFESLPHRRGYGIVIHKEKHRVMEAFRQCNLMDVAFRSTNGAWNLRTSLIEQILIKAGITDD